MTNFYLKFCCFLFAFFFFIAYTSAQNQSFWSKASKKEAALSKKHIRKSDPTKSIHYQLDLEALKHALHSPSKSKNSKSSASNIIEIPNSDGSFDAFSVTESSILEPEYQKLHPEIRTYIGQNINNPSSTISISITPQGFHAMTLSSKTGTQFIDPYTKDGSYIVYNSDDLPDSKSEFECLVPDNPTLASKLEESLKIQMNPGDSKLRTFRLALASTIEYSQFHWQAAGLTAGASEAEKKAAVLAAMAVTMNRVNAVFQRDLAIKMVMVNNTNIIFINSDNYTNSSGSAMLGENQTVVDNVIGSANYDIGHVFSTGGGGIATLRSPCVSNQKARGVTGLTQPVGDRFDLEFVCHEMGHQFGAPHTFNGSTGNCDGTNRNAATAYEPGSGSTIMGYAGICAPQNVQSGGDDYFHQNSIRMIWNNITTGNSTCAQQTTLSNSTPIANAGPDYTIPISTPFKLTGSSTDPDGISTHTYTWEQYDLTTTAGLPLETNTTGPMVRSFEGTNNPIRYIPRFADYLSTGGSTTWEKLPSVNRTMTFALTVRDNIVDGTNGGGQTDVDFMTVTVNSTTPFSVVNPTTSWNQGSTQNIQWVVGQTANASTINCQTVNIKLSIDGGLTFPFTIVSGTPNDGSFLYTVSTPVNTTQARILIEAADNIFYDVSDSNFNIIGEQYFYLDDINLTTIRCGETSAVYNFDYVTVDNFSETTTFSALNLPPGATAVFSPTSRNANGSVTLTISNLGSAPQNNYNITIRGTSPTIVKNTLVNLPFFNTLCASSGETFFKTSTTFVQFNTINQTSAKPSGYSDYTATPTNVTKNSSYDLTVRVNTDGDWTTVTKAWIDWNQNCSFNDLDEEYILGTAKNVSNGNTSLSPLTITIPNDAVSGNVRMRVSTKYSGDGEPLFCETNFDGEVEDYMLNIIPTLSINENEFTNLMVYPNPNKGTFTIKLNGSKSNNVQTEVYDIRGRAVYKNTHHSTSNNFEAQIHVEGLESGMYLLIVNDGVKRHTQKMVIH